MGAVLMAFPATVPADRTIHTEDTQSYYVKNGRWLKHREKTVLDITGQGLDIGATGHVARHRITINSVFKMNGDGHILINMLDETNTWLPMTRWGNGAVQLISGADTWRSSNWKTSTNPTSRGYYLNWANGNDWRCQNNIYHTIELNIADYVNGCVVNWTLFGKSSLNRIMIVRGNTNVSIRSHHIRRIAFNTSATGFHSANHHLEII